MRGGTYTVFLKKYVRIVEAIFDVLSPQVDKVKNPRGVCGFLSRGGGVNFSNQRGVTPPLTPQKISPAAVTIFYSTFFH